MSKDNLGYTPDGTDIKDINNENGIKLGHYDNTAVANHNEVRNAPLDQKALNRERIRIYKNILIVSFGFLFNFTAFSSLSNLQSTLNREEGLGTGGLAVLYASLVVSCMFVPKFLINAIGCKWTIVIAICMYSAYIAANFYAVWATIVPGAIILGIGAAPLWSAKCTYVTELGQKYAKITNQTAEAVINRFFGIFFLIFQTSQVWGNMISSLVLFKPQQNNTQASDDMLKQCGANYCQEPANNTNSNLATIDRQLVLRLCGIYVASAAFGAILVALFLDKLDREKEQQEDRKREKEARLQNVEGEGGQTGTGNTKRWRPEMLIATFRHLKDYNQILLIPLTMYSGLEQAFITGDYTKAYVGCALGTWNVGFVMITFGVANALSSYALSAGVKYLGRVPFFITAAVLNYGVQITLLLWKPHPDMLPVFFIIPGLWGMSDAVWQAQINALYGLLFIDNSEAAFSNYRMWESFGFIMAFAYSSYLCITVKIGILMGFLTVGMLGYFMVEYRQRNARSADLQQQTYDTGNEPL